MNRRQNKSAGKFGVTQNDIARALGLSQSTVAFAMNPAQRHQLPEETIARVLAKAKEMNYRPQRLARILRQGRSHTIGVVYRTGIYHSPQERLKFLAQSAMRAGYQLVAVDLEWFELNEAAAQDYLVGSAVEGVILCNLKPTTTEQWGEFLQARNLPAVAFSSTVKALVDHVEADVRAAVREIVLHHIAQGGRTLQMLLSVRDQSFSGIASPAVLHRAYGFMDAILEAGGKVEMDPEIRRALGVSQIPQGLQGITGEVLYPFHTTEFQNPFEFGRVHTARMIREKTMPDSLVCANDEIAAGAVVSCRELGTAIPEAVRISGGDDAPFSRMCGVPLTTIRQPSKAMAEWAIHRMVELIENPAEREHPQNRLFPCDILLRESSGPVPERAAESEMLSLS